MARRKKPEEHLNHEAWAIPYGDLVTLLLAFFVVMYAISQVNEGKYRVLSDSLVAAFRGTPRTTEPVEIGEQMSGTGAEEESMRMDHQALVGQPRSMFIPRPIDSGVKGGTGPRQEIAKRAAEAAQALKQVADQVENAMGDLIKADLVVVRRSDFWIEVEIKTDILFPSAGATLATNAVGIIERLAKVLAPFNNLVRVEGHTDNRPIRTVAFLSNWELSAARAASVVRVLANQGVAPTRLAVIGYGEYRPRTSNNTDAGRDQNRRVVMVILSSDAKQADPQSSQATPASASAPDGKPPAAGGTVSAP